MIIPDNIHLLNEDVDLYYMQTLLGHNSSRTTEIYPQAANTAMNDIKNPLD